MTTQMASEIAEQPAAAAGGPSTRCCRCAPRLRELAAGRRRVHPGRPRLQRQRRDLRPLPAGDPCRRQCRARRAARRDALPRQARPRDTLVGVRLAVSGSTAEIVETRSGPAPAALRRRR